MAAAPQLSAGDGYGKFRKRAFRRAQTTPYERPRTNPKSNGWLSKIVDPAQRLITYSAHKLFASVLQKRLPPPVPNDADQDSPSAGDGLADLELTLKQKKFTRSEIDRLTAILHSKNNDLPIANEDKKYAVFPTKGVSLYDGKGELPNTPMKDNGLDSQHIPTPIVLDEDVASPAELAKAYMGGRPSKVSPSVLALRGQPVGENAVAKINGPFASKPPIMSDVSRSSSLVVPVDNCFATPRSRGRSAIYSMARTPYSRLHSTFTLQRGGTEMDAFSVPSSSSQSIWESSRYSGSKQGDLKRRSSVLDNDIGSVGPIRRIRQKSNLLTSSGAFSGRGTGLGSDAVVHPSPQNRILVNKPSIGNGDSSILGSGITSIPSKSSEMASKILQQLDVLVSSRDKSPMKLSPSMLRGPALRSLDTIDSSKILDTVQDNNIRLDVKHDESLHNAKGDVSQKQDKDKENGPVRLTALHEKSPAINGVIPTSSVKNNASEVKAISSEMNSVVQAPEKKYAFLMSAHEDYLELDDDNQYDRTTSAELSKEKEKLDINVAENRTSLALASTLEKPAEAKSRASQTPPGDSVGLVVAEKRVFVADQVAPLPGATNQQSVDDKLPTLRSDKVSSPKESNAPPLFSFGDKVVSSKESNGFPPLKFGFKSEGAIPQFSFSTSAAAASISPVVTNSASLKPAIFLDPKSESSSSFAFDATKSHQMKEAESDKAIDKNNLKAGVLFSSTETASSSPAASAFSFGLLSNAASSVNGSLSSTTPSFSSSAHGFSIAGENTSNSCANGGVINATTSSSSDFTNLPLTASAPSFPAFKFSSSVAETTSTSSKTAASGVESKRNETISIPFGTGGATCFSGSSSGTESTRSSIFSGTSSTVASVVTNTGSSTFNFNASSAALTSQSQGFNPFGPQASATGSTVVSTSTESVPIQFGSTAPSPFGFTANTAFSSSGSSASNLFSSVATFGLTSSLSSSSTLESKPVSSTISSTPVFGSGWATTKSPAFGSSSSSSSSTGFVFGASSAASSAAVTTSTAFGSSSPSVFNFSSSASSKPAFASSPSPAALTFGSNDQMSMEDSMAEDTVQATSAVAVFGQQSIPPSSGFIFGSTTPTAGNQFVSTPAVPQATNPFQFAGQAAPHNNQTPFQASGSLEFNAGGSFSLGSGGDKSSRRIVRVSRKTQRKK
ncbi:nuclear pore complex protein NUP1 isoform X2 [Mercurialis annua]|uniref:nuclear pore complex protein NUP1 isoform X2 n=1 Tax=Mercurialis annua TaxID=3986 RepID=UPI00215EB7C9|nr:nuclear pore complex protein NUP1 isoform X2 [Mercurialis annua]